MMSLSQRRVPLVHTKKLNDLLLYLSQSGEEEIAETMGKVVTSLQSAKMQLNVEQTTITKYFAAC